MRKHVYDDGPAPRRAVTILIQVLAATGLVLCLAGAGIGCSGDKDGAGSNGTQGTNDGQGQGRSASRGESDGKQARARLLAVAPPDAVGAIHVDVQRLWKDQMSVLAENPPARINWDKFAPQVAKLKRLTEKTTTVDLFITPGFPQAIPIAVLRGSLTPDGFAEVLKLTPLSGAEMVKEGNGRYTLSPGPRAPSLKVIFGAEADDLSDDLIVQGQADVLTDEFVARLGKPNPTLEALLAGVDTSATIWGAANVPPALGPDAPKSITASANFLGDNPLTLDLVFRDEKTAANFVQGITGTGAPEYLAGLLDAERDGPRVEVRLRGKDLFTAIQTALTRILVQAKRGQSRANLDVMRKTIYAYRSDQRGRSPPTLIELAKEMSLHTRILTSPFSPKSDVPVRPGEVTDPGDYIYIRPLPDSPGDHVMIYEKPEYHGGKATIVAPVYGAVRKMDIKEFQAALKKTKDWLAKRRQ